MSPETHPCFGGDCRSYARLHLPVAPECNVQCNYCLRRFSCVNESRPGVTAAVITPREALERYRDARQQYPRLAVAGIAGPGDSLANWEAVREALTLLRAEDRELALCLSTNGLLLPDYARELQALGLTHLTVTINALRPATAARLYAYVRWQGRKYTGLQAGELLLSRQREGLALLQGSGVKIKINTVVVPDLNEEEVEGIAALAAGLGCVRHNLIPLLPVPGTPLAGAGTPGPQRLQALRRAAEKYLPQMKNCCRCRADALGRLDEKAPERD